MAATIHCLDPGHMEAFLERRRATLVFSSEMSLAENLAAILRKADEFVPSAAGSILLDNPLEKNDDRPENDLTFVAAFGPKAESLIGLRIPASQGIAGHVYTSGEAYHAGDPSRDEFFFSGMDEETEYRTESIVAIPIRIEQDVCGVLELVNRQDASSYSAEDRDMLQIFAGYISISIQNILDGRRAQELAKRDNLTGLFNDHYLHVAMSRCLEQLAEGGKTGADDVVVIFLDLDHFKLVNDNHGHLTGSQLLREIGHLLRRAVHHDDAIPARYGGDEFVMVIPGMGLEEGIDLAESIRTSIVETKFCPRSQEARNPPTPLEGLTASIGVASLQRHVEAGLSLEERKSNLLRLADAAMYVAKATGRNRVAVAAEPVQRRASRNEPRAEAR